MIKHYCTLCLRQQPFPSPCASCFLPQPIKSIKQLLYSKALLKCGLNYHIIIAYKSAFITLVICALIKRYLEVTFCQDVEYPR